jgi:hypothetical protein
MDAMNHFSWTAIAIFVAALIGGALAYDAWIARVSTTRAVLKGVHAKCGPVTNSGPKDPVWTRSVKLYFLMARMEDGQLVRVERASRERPPCGATLKIDERVTPWGTVWYWTEQ